MSLEGKTEVYGGREYDGKVIVTHPNGEQETYDRAERYVAFRDDGSIVLYRYDTRVTTKFPRNVRVTIDEGW